MTDPRSTELRPDSNCLPMHQGLTPQFDALAPVDQGSVLVQWLSSRTNNNPRVIDKFTDRKSP